MKPQALPEAKHWNYYWSLKQTQQFTKISWSKRRITDVLQPFCLKGLKVLDAGCGSGFFSKYFCDQGMDVSSLDYSEEALRIAQLKTDGKAKIFKKDLLSAHLSNEISERFHLIFSDGLLEHFSSDDQDKIFQNFYSLLKGNGILVTFVPNRWSPWELIRPFYMPGIKETPFVLSELIQLNRCNGLVVQQEGGINTFPFHFSPDQFVGRQFGMLLYTIAKKNG